VQILDVEASSNGATVAMPAIANDPEPGFEPSTPFVACAGGVLRLKRKVSVRRLATSLMSLWVVSASRHFCSRRSLPVNSTSEPQREHSTLSGGPGETGVTPASAVTMIEVEQFGQLFK
jgi:hypothetical protein